MSTGAAVPRGHAYAANLTWEGNLGDGTSGYSRYSRRYRVHVEGKPDLAGSADPAFRGEPDRHNPEDLFVSSIAACHMLFYLALSARNGVRVVAYEDEASGTLTVGPDGGGRFEVVVLRPVVTIAGPDGVDLAARLHETAHERCFIANSCRVPVRVLPVVSVSGAAR
jgi:organic hydroperoxide reductase OsmC/OhrA